MPRQKWSTLEQVRTRREEAPVVYTVDEEGVSMLDDPFFNKPAWMKDTEEVTS